VEWLNYSDRTEVVHPMSLPRSPCWWCQCPSQTRGHLFKVCTEWRMQHRILWAETQKETGRWKSRWKIRDLLADGRCWISFRLRVWEGQCHLRKRWTRKRGVRVGAPGAPGAGRIGGGGGGGGGAGCRGRAGRQGRTPVVRTHPLLHDIGRGVRTDHAFPFVIPFVAFPVVISLVRIVSS